MPVPGFPPAAWTLALAALLPGCVSAEFTKLRLDQPPAEEAVARVRTGMSLQDCLDLLGAPDSVQRDEDDRLTVLGWQWYEGSGWGISVSVPLSDQASASLDYARDRAQVKRIQILFDSGLEVVEISTEAPR